MKDFAKNIWKRIKAFFELMKTWKNLWELGRIMGFKVRDKKAVFNGEFYDIDFRLERIEG